MILTKPSIIDFTIRRDENNYLTIDLSEDDLYTLQSGLKQNALPMSYITTDALRAVHNAVITNSKPIRAGNPKNGYMLIKKGAFDSHRTNHAVNRNI